MASEAARENQQACAGGNNDGRYGGNQTVTDGQQGIGGEGCVPVHILLDHTDDDTAHKVHQGDEHACVYVARNKFAGTVHGAVKICFLAQPCTAGIGLFFIQQASVEVGFNGHLLAGHGVQGEAGRHFCDTRGTSGDNGLVQNEQDHKDNCAHNVAAAYNKLAERADDFARSVCAHIAVEQNKAGGRHVERQPQKGRDQQQRRKDGKFQRRGHEHGGYKHQQ